MTETFDELREATVEEQIAEAKRRMEILRIFPETCRLLIEENKLSFSAPPYGAHYFLDEKDREAVTQFETENHAVVYTVIRASMDDSILDACLYVSRYPCEWEQDREDLKNCEAIARVLNRQYPHLSDTGYIGFHLGIAGGLLRDY